MKNKMRLMSVSGKLLRILAIAIVLAALASIIPAIPITAQDEEEVTPPEIDLDQYVGTTGTIVEVTGTNFTGARITIIKFGTQTNILSSPVAITDGEFEAQITVPTLPRSVNAITATSNLGATDSATAATPFSIIPEISIDTTSGQIGNKINVDGSGFTASAALTGYFDGVSAGTGTATATGTISNMILTIPQARGGAHNITVNDASGASEAVRFTLLPTLTAALDASSDNKVDISGSGFTASSEIKIELDNTVINEKIKASNAGIIAEITITIPAVSAGSHTLKATDSSGRYGEAAISTISMLSVSPQSGPIGSQVMLYGTGFAAGKTISITYDGTQISTDTPIKSDASGDFQTMITVPNSVSGTYTILASDKSGSTSTKFTALATVFADGDNSGIVGVDMPISGNGFNAASEVNIKYDNVLVNTAKVDENGTFSSTVKLTPGPAGRHKVIATDGVNSSYFFVTLIPTARCSAAKGNIGMELTVSGDAYKPGSTVTVKYDSAAEPSATVDASGSFSTSFKVPQGKAGNHIITVTDGTNDSSFTFVIQSANLSAPLAAYPLIATKADPVVRFQWNPVNSPNGEVTYDLQVSPDSSFNNVIIDKKGLTAIGYQLAEEENAALTPVSNSNPYYWRVRAKDAAGTESLWSLPSNFTFGSVFPHWIFYIIYVLAGIGVLVGGFYLGRRFHDIEINWKFWKKPED